MVKLGDMRKEYQQQPLKRADLVADPIEQFDRWFQEAVLFGVQEANACILATVSDQLRPSARVMLLKHYDETGFVFFTNYESQKSQHLGKNPFAALVFWWKEQVRQIRIEGKVQKLETEMSDMYFKKRNRQANLGAYASRQSQPIASRDELLKQYENCIEKFKNTDPLPRPEFWGGYQLIPDRLEFWQGGENRLHDRFCYQKNESNQWEIVRLSP